jgi:S-formylglutathione hydrolase FrmB
VLYLLHDSDGNHTVWSRLTRLEWYARDLPLAIVLPDGERGFYTDVTPGHAHEQLIVQDLMSFVERFFPVRSDRAGRAIGGFGVGGYGAVKLALKYPHLFASVTGHASTCNLGHSLDQDADPQWKAEYLRLFGPNSKGGDDDIFALARRYEGPSAVDGHSWPALSLDCGVDDPLLEENRAFHAHLERLGVEHEYAELPGSHNWDYGDACIPRALAFHWQTLGQRSGGEWAV